MRLIQLTSLALLTFVMLLGIAQEHSKTAATRSLAVVSVNK